MNVERKVSMKDLLPVADEHLRLGRLADAEPLYRRVLEFDNNSWEAHLGLGRCLLGLYGFAKANPHFQELVRLAPHEGGPAFLARGEYQARQGKPLQQVRPWFLHAAKSYLDKDLAQEYQLVCRRVMELGMEPITPAELR